MGLSESTLDRVERMVGLPLTWTTIAGALRSAETAWPVRGMFRIAAHLIENPGGLPQDWEVSDTKSPSRVLAAGVPLTGWGYAAGRSDQDQSKARAGSNLGDVHAIPRRTGIRLAPRLSQIVSELGNDGGYGLTERRAMK